MQNAEILTVVSAWLTEIGYSNKQNVEKIILVKKLNEFDHKAFLKVKNGSLIFCFNYPISSKLTVTRFYLSDPESFDQLITLIKSLPFINHPNE